MPEFQMSADLAREAAVYGFVLPNDFESWNDYQREDWAASGETRPEQSFRYHAIDELRERLRPRPQIAVVESTYEDADPEWDETSAPPACPEGFDYRHDKSTCPRCLARRRWAQEMADAWFQERDAAIVGDPSLRGAAIFDAPTSRPIWGDGSRALTAEGQATMLVGRDGAGKTTVTAQYGKARAGLGQFAGQLLGLPVVPLPEGQRVVYFAMDRPMNALDRIRAGLSPTNEMKAELGRRMTVYPGPPPYDLSRETGQRWLLDYLLREDAGLVIFDSRKDLGDPNDDPRSIGIMAMEKHVTAAGVEVFVNHHPVQAYDGGTPSLEHAFGRRWVYAGMGSILFLTGDGTSPRMKLKQVKAPFGEMLSIDIEHDLAAGTTRELQRIQIASGPSMTPIEMLRKHIDPVTGWAMASDLVADAGAHWGRKPADVLKELVDRGIVKHEGRSSYSRYREVKT